MQLTPVETALNAQVAPLDADMHTYGFPPCYFLIRSEATERNLDVEMGMVEDGTSVVLWPETESSLVESMRNPSCDNQVFFIDTSGALCSRGSGHAIDIENDRLVLRHRRPVTYPFPNAYSHPLPRFSYDRSTRHITVTFPTDPSYQTSRTEQPANSAWKEKTYLLTSIPARKPRTIIDDATTFFSTAITNPLSLFSPLVKPGPSATPDNVFSDGEIDLREDEILEQDRTEEGEVDDSPEPLRRLRVVALTKEELHGASAKARLRMQWAIYPLRLSKNRTASV